MTQYRKLGKANEEVARRLHDHLTRAFEGFANEEAERSERGLEYIDALMGCHNFYKRIILDLEARTDGTGAFKIIALSTLQEALERDEP